MIKRIGALVLLGHEAMATCMIGSAQECTDEASCVGVQGVWIPVANATDLPATAVDGGRRFTLGQSDAEFETIIFAPNGGYCTQPLSVVPQECQNNATQCDSLDSCYYRTNGGRWFRSSESQTCISNCSHPLVYCDKTRCETTLGCDWFVKTQSSADQCFCIDNPGLFGNPPKKARITWIFWDQPVSLPVFVIAIIAIIAIAWNIWIYNLKPFFLKVFKKKPRE